MSDLEPVTLPESFYLSRLSRCGFEIRDVMPWEGAITYVTDRVRIGVQFRDGTILWLLEPTSDRLTAGAYRINPDFLPPGVGSATSAQQLISAIWRTNAEVFSGQPSRRYAGEALLPASPSRS